MAQIKRCDSFKWKQKRIRFQLVTYIKIVREDKGLMVAQNHTKGSWVIHFDDREYWKNCYRVQEIGY